jgi:hypothetical protein
MNKHKSAFSQVAGLARLFMMHFDDHEVWQILTNKASMSFARYQIWCSVRGSQDMGKAKDSTGKLLWYGLATSVSLDSLGKS